MAVTAVTIRIDHYITSTRTLKSAVHYQVEPSLLLYGTVSDNHDHFVPGKV
jgi:hypothetical protein